jgi:glycosyltransferase involved in cell wall biosynthesis
MRQTAQAVTPRTKPISLLSVVVPSYNEQEVLREFHGRLSAALSSIQVRIEIIYVNDGSMDGTLGLIRELRRQDSRIAIVDLSRNFGKEIALAAGLDHARGDAVVILDADLQDPPELISEFLEGYRQGYEVVYGQRRTRQGETFLKRATAFAFYRVIQSLTRVWIPQDTGDFRLISRQTVDSINQLREQRRFMKGLFAWVGFPQKAVLYDRSPRFAGRTKWNYWKLWNFALEGITSFSTAPLRAASYIGITTAAAALVYAAWIVYKTLAFGEPVRGYPSLMVVILFLGGVQLTTIGILGEYLGRVFDETKRRPLYFVKEFEPAVYPDVAG